MINIKENFIMAFESLFSNKMRSFLTMLGIIIGVASVISMVSIGKGAQKQAEESIQSLGSNIVNVYSGSGRFHGPGGVSGSSKPLTIEDYEILEKKLENVEAVIPIISGSGIVKYKEKTINTRVYGVTAEWLEVKNCEMESGRFISQSDSTRMKKYCVIGNNIKTQLFGDIDPVGMTIRIRNSRYKIIGILKEKGEGSFEGTDDQIFIPFKTARYRMFQTQNLNSIIIQLDKIENTDKVSAQITEILRTQHNLTSSQEDDFSIRSQKEIQERVTSMTQTFTVLLGGIAVVSLIVGGIGIMNIMLVTVTERTKEIGIRKAIGARPARILGQFLFEAITLSMFGGILGIFVGAAISFGISKIGNWATQITFQSILYSFLFSFSIGLFFGMYPARKAAKMDPIQALRYE